MWYDTDKHLYFRRLQIARVCLPGGGGAQKGEFCFYEIF